MAALLKKKISFVEKTDVLKQEEIDLILNDLKDQFLCFREKLILDQVDFADLKEYELSILDACNINLNIPLPTGYTCKIDKLYRDRVCFSVVFIDFLSKSIVTKKSLLEMEWTQLSDISVCQEDIPVFQSALNLITNSKLSLVYSKEKNLLNLAKKLQKLINTELDSQSTKEDKSVEFESASSVNCRQIS